MYTGSPGHITLEVRKSGVVSARLRYSKQGKHQRRLGDLPVSPTPLLDVCIGCIGKDRISTEELIRLRDIDKSWSLVARLFS